MFNIFTFLRENKVYLEVRARVYDLLVEKKREAQALLTEYVKEKQPAAKTIIIGWIMDHIKLKFPYSLFKGKVKKSLEKNFDKVVEFALIKLQEI